MDNQDEALRRLRQTYERERAERALEAQTGAIAGTAAKPGRRLPRPSRRALRWLIALVVLAAIATPLVMVGTSYVQRLSAADTASTFCADLTKHNYTAAYGMLSHRVRQARSETQFANDVRSGHLISCDISNSNEQVVVSGNLATVPVSYVFSDASGASAVSDPMGLVSENGGWRVDAIDWFNPYPSS